MIVGFVGSGNMAAAMARGWAGEVEAMLFTDSGSGRAAELAAEVGGEAVASNAELAERSDVVVLAVKPAMLEQVAAELGGARAVISLLGATPLESVAAAFPERRRRPGDAERRRRGRARSALRRRRRAARQVREAARPALGHVVELPDAQFDAATAVMGCAPAYLALAVEALADAGAAAGLDEELARELVVETTAGTAELLRLRHPADVRRAVASPGGSTEAGLEALDREGAREAFEAAVARLAGEDERGLIALALTRVRRRRLRRRALPRLHHPDPAQHPDLLDAADAVLQPLVPGLPGLRHRDDQPVPQPLPPAAAARSAAAASRSTSARSSA